MTTIEGAEAARWPEPESGSSFLVRRCHALRRKPLTEFTVEDMRIMLSQQIGVGSVLPFTVEVLLRDPFAEGDYYPGDLLSAVLRLPEPVWSDRALEQQRLAEVLRSLLSGPHQIDGELHELINGFLYQAT